MSDVQKTLDAIDAVLAECTVPVPGRWDAIAQLMSDYAEQNRAGYRAAYDAVLAFVEAWTRQLKASLDGLNSQAAAVLDQPKPTVPAPRNYRGGHRG